MSEITCPVKRWPGTIRLPDYLNFRLEREWERAIEEIGNSGDVSVIDAGAKPDLALIILPVLLSIVQEWKLGGGFPAYPTIDDFPATPKQSSALLIAWVIGEINKLYEEGQEIPLAS